MRTSGFTYAALSALPLLAGAATVPEKVQAVRNAITSVEKINALEDGDFVFNFADPAAKATSGAGGKLVAANVGNFPALVGAGMALTVGWMEACGMNSPHTHPRATEILLLLNGEISAGFLTENGSRFVVNNVTELSAMVFPAGSIHFQANYGCEPVQFVAALSNEDPGTLQVAQRFFALSADVVGASLGGLGVQQVEDLAHMIPDNMIAGTKECYDRCKIPYPTEQPKKQQQPTATGTSATSPAPTATSTQNVIDVIVGKDLGLTYTPDDITAAPGDVVRFHFTSKNHTLTQSSFDSPCTPLQGGFDSGFVPIGTDGKETVFELQVVDDKPIWFGCQQKGKDAAKNHCQLGMNGAVNAPKKGDKTLAAFKAKATGGY